MKKKENKITSNREQLIDFFLISAGLKNFERIKIPGDASFRKYERIICSNSKAQYILMDSPPDKEDVKPFIKIDEILISLGLKAPKIISKNIDEGLLLLEDFGHKKFNNIFSQQPELQENLYKNAIDVLVHLFNNKQNFDIALYSKEKLISEANLLVEWYLPLFHNFSKNELEHISAEYQKLIAEILDNLILNNDTLVLRDYHADNLMLLEGEPTVKTVGLLDFQDALIGNPAYDLVSLLEDARRDVPTSLQKSMIEYYCNQMKSFFDAKTFLNDYNILGAQRNLKIIGIFSRLKARDNKPVYLPLIPRVKNYLIQDLQHEKLAKLKNFLEKIKVI